MTRTPIQDTARDLEALFALYRSGRHSDEFMDKLCEVEIGLFEKVAATPAGDFYELAAKGRVLKASIEKELDPLTRDISASLVGDIERMGGETYEPIAEELASARAATDFQTVDDGYHEDPGDGDEALAA